MDGLAEAADVLVNSTSLPAPIPKGQENWPPDLTIFASSEKIMKCAKLSLNGTSHLQFDKLRAR